MLEVKNIFKSFKTNEHKTDVLNNVSFKINQGDIACIIGESGIGKTTLLNIMGGILKQCSGDILINGECVKTAFTKRRIDLFGYIFQSHSLLPEFNIEENLLLPQIIANKSIEKSKKEINYFLKMFNLLDKSNMYPNNLSTGQCQRIAIIRSIINDPKIIIADEPTGNLDKKNSELILELFVKLNKELGKTFIIATHDMNFKSISNKILEIKNKKVELLINE